MVDLAVAAVVVLGLVLDGAPHVTVERGEEGGVVPGVEPQQGAVGVEDTVADRVEGRGGGEGGRGDGGPDEGGVDEGVVGAGEEAEGEGEGG